MPAGLEYAAKAENWQIKIRCWDKTVNLHELVKSMPDGGSHPDLTLAGLENYEDAFCTLMTEANCRELNTTPTLAPTWQKYHVHKGLERKLPGY